jgi:hypothetical protein
MASSGSEAAEVEPPERAGDVDRERGEALVLELLGAYADSLLRVARRYSMCGKVVLLRKCRYCSGSAHRKCRVCDAGAGVPAASE